MIWHLLWYMQSSIIWPCVFVRCVAQKHQRMWGSKGWWKNEAIFKSFLIILKSNIFRLNSVIITIQRCRIAALENVTIGQYWRCEIYILTNLQWCRIPLMQNMTVPLCLILAKRFQSTTISCTESIAKHMQMEQSVVTFNKERNYGYDHINSSISIRQTFYNEQNIAYFICIFLRHLICNV